MAEPVILSYARGLLKEFPGVPEGTVDVIPVDIVVAAIITVAAVGPERAAPITQVASGGINPLKYKLLVDNVRAWFTEHPLYDAEGQPIVVPEWQFPARGRVKEQLERAQSIIGKTERVLQALPLRGKQAAWAANLEEKKNEIDRAYEYVQLYGLYTECEAIYQVDKLIAMWDTLAPADQAAFNFDPRSVDWPTYISTIHLPSIVHHSRAKVTPGKNKNDRTARLRKSVLSPDRHVAAFDLENTLISSNVVESYSWLATRRLNTPERIRYVLRTLAEAPTLSKHRPQGPQRLPALLLPPLRRRTGGADRGGLAGAAQPADPRQVVPRRPPPGARAPRARPSHDPHHRRARLRRRGPAPAVRRDRRRQDDRPPRRHLQRQLAVVPPTGETRAEILADYCASEGLKLEESIAYADSTSDLPMLEPSASPSP
jgi:fatty acyl-CoA reductase